GTAREERLRGTLEVDRNLGQLIGQPLAGAHIEGNSRPAPVVDVELDRNVSLGARIRIHALFLAIAGQRLALDLSRPVLSSDRVAGDLILRHGRGGAQTP